MPRSSGAKPADRIGKAWQDPTNRAFPWRGTRHAWLGYAGGSRRSPRPVGLSASVRGRHLDCEFAAYGSGDGAVRDVGQDADHDGHVPAAGTAGLLDMIVESAVVVVHDMLMNRA